MRWPDLQQPAGRAGPAHRDLREGQRLVGRDDQPRAEAADQQRRQRRPAGARRRHVVDGEQRAGEPDGDHRQPDRDQRPAEPVHHPAAQRRRRRRADRERRDRQPRLQRAVVQPGLQVEREDEEQRGEAGEVQGDQRRRRRSTSAAGTATARPAAPSAGGCSGTPRPRRRPAAGRRPRISSHFARPCHCCSCTSGSSRTTIAGAEQADPDGVVVVPAPLLSSGRGSSRQANGIAARPIGRLMKNTQRQPVSLPNAAISAPPEQRPDRGGDADDRAEQAEGGAALAAGEQLLDDRADLRGEQAAGQALDQPGDDQERGWSAPARRPSEARVNSPSATTNIVRRPRASPTRPAGTSSSPKVSA